MGQTVIHLSSLFLLLTLTSSLTIWPFSSNHFAFGQDQYRLVSESGISGPLPGMECVIPNDSDALRTKFMNLSAQILPDWTLKGVNVGCFGSIQATYLLPAFTTEKLEFIVGLDSIPRQLVDMGKPFDVELVQNHNILVASIIQNITADNVFQEAAKEWTKVDVNFGYGSMGHYSLEGFAKASTCNSNIEVENSSRDDVISARVANDINMSSSIPIISFSRDMIAQYSSNHLDYNKSKVAFNSVSNSTCGYLRVYTSSSCCPITPYAYTASSDVNCEGCPSVIQVHMYDNFIPFLFEELDSKGKVLKSTRAQNSAISQEITPPTGEISTNLLHLKDVEGRMLDTSLIGTPVVLSYIVHDGKFASALQCLAILEVRDESGITQLLEVENKSIAQGNFADVGMLWRPEKAGNYELRALLITNSSQPEILKSVITSSFTINPSTTWTISKLRIATIREGDLPSGLNQPPHIDSTIISKYGVLFQKATEEADIRGASYYKYRDAVENSPTHYLPGPSPVPSYSQDLDPNLGHSIATDPAFKFQTLPQDPNDPSLESYSTIVQIDNTFYIILIYGK